LRSVERWLDGFSIAGRFSSNLDGFGEDSDLATFSAGARFSSAFGGCSDSGFGSLSTGLSSSFGAACGLLSFSPAGSFSPGFGLLKGNTGGTGCPGIGSFSFVSVEAFPAGGVTSAMLLIVVLLTTF
jgi:hypothetical protein